ncbi:MAG: enoyl-CoA hydratase/isomerase family protein [Chloroflexi bacterium]|nr:enoyl-CoA hydratase/isomerase family protein [Chloroflexota bacterium]
MEYKSVIVKKEGHIATIILNRPQALNSLNGDLIEDLPRALDEVSLDDKMRVMILTGAGRAFSAGGDIKEGGPERALAKMKPEMVRMTLRRQVQKISKRLATIDIPTIAMMNGVAAGAGFDWAVTCDFRIGSEKSRFKVAFTSLAVVSPDGGLWHLPRLVGIEKAKELLFTDSMVEAEEAYRIGLLTRLVKHEDLEKETMAFAARIAKGPPTAIKLAKLIVNKAPQHDMETSLEMAALAQAINLPSEDHEEGVQAFSQKREAVFRGV